MIVLAWNGRGLGQSRTVQALKELVETNRPDVLFLSETVVAISRITRLKQQLRFDDCFAVNNVGHNGGLAMFWNKENKVAINIYHRHFIDCDVEDERQIRFRLTGFYGISDRTQRRESWALLKVLSNRDNGPWCIIGDFNDILSDTEKRGRSEHPSSLIRGFQEAVEECSLIDIPLQGYPFTWSRARGKPHGIEEKLDRYLANSEWLNLFPEVMLLNLVAPVSDHTPLLLCTHTMPLQLIRRRFRFENEWTTLPEWKQLVN
ncbi:hypothetical protein LINGRAHAP2_LOCUS1581 [Linum grandiflorum]